MKVIFSILNDIPVRIKQKPGKKDFQALKYMLKCTENQCNTYLAKKIRKSHLLPQELYSVADNCSQL
jgi:hypothetical protein